MRVEVIEEIPDEMKPYKPREDRELVKSDAADILRWLMTTTAPPQIRTPAGRRMIQLIVREPFWKYGTCDGDTMVQFATPEAITGEGELRRDHVYPLARTIELLKPRWGDTKYALSLLEERSMVCGVTKAQHSQLGKFDVELDGFERYRAAGLTVVDRVTGDAVPLPVSDRERRGELEREKLELAERLKIIQRELGELWYNE